MDGCITAAFSHHPLLEGAIARVAAAQALARERSAERKPSVSLGGDSGYLRGSSVSPFVVLGGRGPGGETDRFVAGNYYQGSVMLEVPILKDGALALQTSHYIREAKIEIRQQEMSGVALRRQIATGVVQAYFGVLKYREQIPLHEGIISAREVDVRMTAAQLEQRLVSRSEALLAEVHLASARHDLAYAGLLLTRSQQELVRAIGLPMSTDVDVKASPTPGAAVPPLEEALLRLSDAPDLKAFELSVRAKHEEVRRLEKERYPVASLRARYALGDDYRLPIVDEGGVWLSLNWRPFDSGLYRQRVAVAVAQEREERTKLQELRLDLEANLREIYRRLLQLDAGAELIAKQIEYATEALRLSEARYRQGLVPQSAFAEAEVALLQLQIARIDNDHDRRLAHTQLRILNGEWDGPRGSNPPS
jgi:outer membrane protein TolC